MSENVVQPQRAAPFDPAVLLALAERCEKEEPSFAMECAIAEAIGAYSTPPRNYTVSLDAAVTLVPVETWKAEQGDEAGYAVVECGPVFVVSAKTPALALCAAALRARAALAGNP